VLKNTSKGNQLEKKISVPFHQEGLPLLISPHVLRIRGLGQIDLARFVKTPETTLEICEVKSSEVGYESMRLQRRRLQRAAGFLGAVFGKTIKFIVKVG
jgi:hypothetical protein